MAEKLNTLLMSGPSPEERKKNLDAWELTLTCDHTTRYIQHREHDHVSTSVVDCAECGTRRGIVASRRIGPAYTDEATISDRETADKDRLETELAAARAKLARQQNNVMATQRRIAELEEQLGPSHTPSQG